MSRNVGNTVCGARIDSNPYYVIIHINSFTFHGPNMMVEFSDYVCQYGELIIQFDGRKHQSDFCESLDDQKIYTRHLSFTFKIVWFSGYSSSDFSAFLTRTKCYAVYTESSLSKAPISNIYYRTVNNCAIYVVPALQNKQERKCTVALGPPSLGTARIRLIKENTLSACDTYFSQRKNDHLMTDIRSVSFDNWPLTLAPNVSHYIHNITEEKSLTFEYLHSATVSMPFICIPGQTRTQMAIMADISSCSVPRYMKRSFRLVVNNIPSLGDYCMRNEYHFTPTSEGGGGETI